MSSKFSAKTTAENAMLNSKVRELAKIVGDILTRCYNELYDDDAVVSLPVTPESAAPELLKMTEAKVLSRPLATERAMAILGAFNGPVSCPHNDVNC